MSAEARDAYSRGERPLSRWTKTDIIKVIAEILESEGISRERICFNTWRRDYLKLHALRYCGSYCTSLASNKMTDFFEIDRKRVIGMVEDVIDDDFK